MSAGFYETDVESFLSVRMESGVEGKMEDIIALDVIKYSGSHIGDGRNG